MDPNQETGERNRAVNQASAPVSIAKPLQKSPNESLDQGYVLCSLVPEYAVCPIVICARCLTLTYQRSVSFKPTTTKPLYASVSQEVNQAFTSPSTATNLQDLDKSQGEAYGLKSSVPVLVHDEVFPAASSVSCNYQRSISPKTVTEAAVLNSLVPQSLHDSAVPCGGCVTCTFRSNIFPKPSTTEPCNASVAPSNNYVFWPAYLNSQQSSLMPMSHVNVMAEVGNGAVPFVHGTLDEPTELGRGYSSRCEAAACDLTRNKLHAAVLIDRCNLMEQQSIGQCRSPLTDKASPLGQCGLDWKGAYESFSINAKADHRTGLEGHNVGMTSPTLSNQFYDENGPLVINFPKCISIRADSHTRQIKVASNTTGTALLPIYHSKPHGHRRQGAPTMNEVQEQTKVVALAENLACLAFPQGMYKTEMCNKWLRSMGQYCPYGDKCQFAHGSHELRPVLRHRRYKTILCRMVAAGEPCPYEHRCHFRHVIYPHEAEVLALNSIPKSASSTSK